MIMHDSLIGQPYPISQPRKNGLRRWVGLMFFCLATSFLNGCSKDGESGQSGITVQQTNQFFESKFADVNGTMFELSALRGKTVVVNFWATWCPPCVEEMPMFDDVYNEWKAKNVVFVGIATDQAGKVQQFLKTSPVDYMILVGGQPGFELSRTLGNRHGGVPYTVILDPQGQPVARHVGLYPRKELETALSRTMR